MWKMVKLGDIAKIYNGGTPKSNIKDYWAGKVEWLTPKDMGKLNSRYVYRTERQITESGLSKLEYCSIKRSASSKVCCTIGKFSASSLPMSRY